MKVKVHYFASLREQRGCSEEWVESSAVNAIQLYRELKNKHSFSLDESLIKCAINVEMASMHSLLEEGTTITFLPPVSGG